MIAQYYSKNCVRLTTSSPASPKQEAPKEGAIRSGGGDVSCTPYDPIAPAPPKSGMMWRVARLVRTPYYVPHRPPLPSST